LSSGDVGVHKLKNGVLIALLGEFDGDRGRSIGDEVLHLSPGDVGVHELEDGVLVGLLGQLDGDGGRSISDEVLHLSSGNVSIHELEDGVFVRLLGKLDGDGGWPVGDEVLHLASSNVGIHELEDGVLIGLLGKLDSDGGRSVGNEVLHLSSGDIGVHKLEDGVFVGLLDVGIKLDELLGNRRGLVLDEGLKGLLGDVLTVELANDGLGGLSSGLLETRSSIRDGVVSIIIRETLIELGGKELTTVPLVEDLSTSGRRNSSDHHGDGDVVMVIGILNLISILAEDGSKSIVTNNFSESLKSNAINDVSVEFGVAIDVDSVNLINGDHEGLTIGNHISRRQVHGAGSTDGGTISININVGDDLVEGVL